VSIIAQAVMPLLSQSLGALLTGLAASGHCFGMCGGLQAALAPGASTSGLWRLQLGRTGAYLALGAIAGGLTGATSGLLPANLHQPLRWLAVGLATLVLLGLACRLLGQRDLFGFERIGTMLWRSLQPVGRLVGAWREPWRSLALGMVWAFIPCALVLSMVALAATTGSVWRGACLMGAFALGTWPALLGAAAIGRAFTRLAADSPGWLRTVVAAALLLLAAAQFSFLSAGAHHHGQSPGTTPPHAGHPHHHPPSP
jgi:uncharacterized protein